MHLTIDYLATGILLSVTLGIIFLKNFLFSGSASPSLAFSRLRDLTLSSWRSQLAVLPNLLLIAALLCFMIAFIDPHFLFPKSANLYQDNSTNVTLPTEGIAIYLILDQSGSMAEEVEATTPHDQKIKIAKIDLLKQVTKQFILTHSTDLIGVVSFARVPKVLVPLTLDQTALLKQLEQIQVVKNSEEDGTAMGYAIYKTANLLATTRHFANDLQQEWKPPYTIKSAIMIVVTDGFQDPSRLDYGNRLRTMELDDAAAYAKSQNIRLYVINIDPALSTAQYAPQRRQLQAITTLTGGQFYLVDSSQDLSAIYKTINQLEKGSIQQVAQLQSQDFKSAYRRFSLYPFLIFLGLGCLFVSFLLDLTLLRRTP